MVSLNVLPDPAKLAQSAADFICGRVQQNPELKVLVATGNTPMLTYAELARRATAGEVDFSRVTAFQLDEYADLAEGDPRSLWGWMERSFVRPLGITRVVRLTDPAIFEARVRELGGVDLAILGLGPNGHLGFNEPPSAANAPTRWLDLTPESLQSNQMYWEGQTVPTRAITAGMNVILAAREVLLLVTGEAKRDILHRALAGNPSPDLPASYLQHVNLTVLADEAAAS